MITQWQVVARNRVPLPPFYQFHRTAIATFKMSRFPVPLRIRAGKQTPHASYLLTPFPRVGRGGGGAATWDLEPGYPRGPNALVLNNDDRSRRMGPKNVNTGLWFGPRLGRIQKRGDRILDDPWSYIILRDIPAYRHIPKYTPRLGRESQENMDDNAEDMNQASSDRA
ncbi:hypothetical protein Trydic_g9777 [Trypoxylus dichotomus]